MKKKKTMITHQYMNGQTMLETFGDDIVDAHDYIAWGFDMAVIEGKNFFEKAERILAEIKSVVLDTKPGNNSSFSVHLLKGSLEWSYPGNPQCVVIFFGSDDEQYNGSTLETLCRAMMEWTSYVTAESGSIANARLVYYFEPNDRILYENDEIAQIILAH